MLVGDLIRIARVFVLETKVEEVEKYDGGLFADTLKECAGREHYMTDLSLEAAGKKRTREGSSSP